MSPPDQSNELDTQIREIVEQYLIAYGCKVCGGGGTDDNNETCTNCKGLGIVDFETKYIVDNLKTLINQARGDIPKIEITAKLEALDKLIMGAGEYHDDPYEYVVPLRHIKQYYADLKKFDLTQPILKEAETLNNPNNGVGDE